MASGFRSEQRQSSTNIDPFYGEKPDHGRMIFAERCEVESEEWWTQTAQMVYLVVQRTGPGGTFNYPWHAANIQTKHVRVNPRSEKFRQPELDAAMPYIQKALANGQNVFFVACSPSTERQLPPQRHTGV